MRHIIAGMMLTFVLILLGLCFVGCAARSRFPSCGPMNGCGVHTAHIPHRR